MKPSLPENLLCHIHIRDADLPHTRLMLEKDLRIALERQEFSPETSPT